MTPARNARHSNPRRPTAFTLVEVTIAVVIIGLLATVGTGSYLRYQERARIARAVTEIDAIATLLSGFAADNPGALPDSLADLGEVIRVDPWGNPYQYLKIFGGLPPGLSSIEPGLPDVAAPPAGAGGGGGGGGPPGGGGGGGPPAIALARKDRFLVPINSDFDLYSMGADGESMPPLQNPKSRDDVIRAGNGAYIGIAELY
jgi:general secretion pathway protein G